MRLSINDITKLKTKRERIVMITAYDYTSAQIVDRAEIPLILVGDSLGMVVLGHSTTVPVTLDEMIHHIRAVVRGSQRSLVVGDLPFLTYATPEQALRSAGRCLQEAGCQAVKLEGGRQIAPTVERLVQAGVPVMGHLGYTPQSVNQIGQRVQGKRADPARRLIEDALALEAAGAFAVVLELIPASLAQAVTERLRIPTIGIGAGVECDGEVQVWHDLLGLYTDFTPRHTRQYATLAETISAAVRSYADDVKARRFPGPENSSDMDPKILAAALRGLDEQKG